MRIKKKGTKKEGRSLVGVGARRFAACMVPPRGLLNPAAAFMMVKSPPPPPLLLAA
jgi:hypothetical protein